MKQFWSFIIIVLLASCNSATENKTVESSLEESKIIEEKPKLHVDTLSFVAYNDDGDYFLLYAKKNKEDFSFINDKNDDRSFLKGDVIEVIWKNDTIYIAGDGETPELAEWVVSTRKIKDGTVSAFRKHYKKELKYNWSKEFEYSQGYLDQLYLVVEYYIANSQNQLIKEAVESKEQIEYSIEEQIRNNKEYTVIGIATVSEHKVSTIQWLYYQHGDALELYEYDLPNDELIKFE
ncbi:hypothetical protein ACFSX9_14695 [Flavobacterium ardleyense]|uniref:Lipoprotein n=1 Tax=Flavobacterium ardleyense TaxID=2038737 RepID=A0ABW5ZD25_9FLAO